MTLTPAIYRHRARAIIGTNGWTIAQDHALVEKLFAHQQLTEAELARFHDLREAMTDAEMLPTDAQDALRDVLAEAVRQ